MWCLNASHMGVGGTMGGTIPLYVTVSPNSTPESSSKSERFYSVVDSQTTLHATVIAKING